jgi:3-methyl-2-oxobutanoate hydroxymethyltransferase
MQRDGVKIAMLTCYDASFAALCERAGVDVVLIGDSLGNVIQGQATTLPVTLDDLCYHVRAVARGCSRPLIIADLPFGTYQESPEQAYRTSVAAMQAGAHMVKLEGGAWIAPTIRFLIERSVPVCAHIGLMPQSINALGGYKVQGKTDESAQRLVDEARALSEAGAALIVLELIPRDVAARVTRESTAATIGIGAGPDCAGQVLVIYDALGMQTSKPPRFVRNFMQGSESIEAAIARYVASVKDGSFPAAEHCF